MKVRLRGQPDPFHVRLGSTDWLVLEEIFQRDEYTLVRQVVKDACWIVDLGANAGYSLRYWMTIFPRARIVALEPEPDNCRICSRNIGSARIDSQVTLLQAAVGTHRGQIQLVDSGEGEWGYRTEAGPSAIGQMVDVLPLSDVLETYAKGQRIDLLKCDIEGAEKALFDQCQTWIKKVKAIVIELHPPYRLQDLLVSLERGGAHFEVAALVNRKLCPIVLLRQAGSHLDVDCLCPKPPL